MELGDLINLQHQYVIKEKPLLLDLDVLVLVLQIILNLHYKHNGKDQNLKMEMGMLADTGTNCIDCDPLI